MIPQGFLDDIIAHPADDTPRLICADWLEENGQEARAEFIRVQCNLHGWDWSPVWSKSNHLELHCECCGCALRTRERELFDAVRAADDVCTLIYGLQPPGAFAQVGSRTVRWGNGAEQILLEFSRGFISILSLPWSVWLAHADHFRSHAPIQEVRLPTEPEWESEIWKACKVYDSFLALRWPRIKFTWPTEKPLITIPHIPGLHLGG